MNENIDCLEKDRLLFFSRSKIAEKYNDTYSLNVMFNTVPHFIITGNFASRIIAAGIFTKQYLCSAIFLRREIFADWNFHCE